MRAFYNKKKKLTSFQIIVLGFSGVILLGTIFLMLPLSSRVFDSYTFIKLHTKSLEAA